MVDAKGWFVLPWRTGDRTLEQQLLGLDDLFDGLKGKTVLDVGCAEGLISQECAKRGALAVHGVDILQKHVDVASAMGGATMTFSVEDANSYCPPEYSIVLLLSVLHKLRDPSASCVRLISACEETCVIRLPPKHAPVIVDPRSGCMPHNIDEIMVDNGFSQVAVTAGPFDEWTAFYARR